MPWSRRRIGNVKIDNVVHALYEWHKEGRMFWDTQCDIQWSDRNNTVTTHKPYTTKQAALTCITCIATEIRVGARAGP